MVTSALTHDLKALAETPQNFCRVFEVPEEFPRGFAAGQSVVFRQMDWFDPLPDERMRHEHPDLQLLTWEHCRAALTEYLREKDYVRPGGRYLVITEFDEAFVFRAEKNDA